MKRKEGVGATCSIVVKNKNMRDPQNFASIQNISLETYFFLSIGEIAPGGDRKGRSLAHHCHPGWSRANYKWGHWRSQEDKDSPWTTLSVVPYLLHVFILDHPGFWKRRRGRGGGGGGWVGGLEVGLRCPPLGHDLAPPLSGASNRPMSQQSSSSKKCLEYFLYWLW